MIDAIPDPKNWLEIALFVEVRPAGETCAGGPMEQTVSGLRIWTWAVMGLFVTGILVLGVVLAGQGFQIGTFNPRLTLMAFFFLALAIAVFVFMRGKRESKSDLS